VLNTEDILPADECDPATENAAAIMLSSGSNNEEEPCKNQTMGEESKNAGDVVEFRKIIGNVRKQSTSRADKCPDKYRTMSCVKSSILKRNIFKVFRSILTSIPCFYF